MQCVWGSTVVFLLSMNIPLFTIILNRLIPMSMLLHVLLQFFFIWPYILHSGIYVQPLTEQ